MKLGAENMDSNCVFLDITRRYGETTYQCCFHCPPKRLHPSECYTCRVRLSFDKARKIAVKRW